MSELGIAYLYFQVVVHFETVQSGYLDKLRALIPQLCDRSQLRGEPEHDF